MSRLFSLAVSDIVSYCNLHFKLVKGENMIAKNQNWLAKKVGTEGLKCTTVPEHVVVKMSPDDGRFIGLSWPYETKDSGLYQMAKRRGGIWDSEIRAWTFQEESVTQNFLETIIKRHPDWPVVGIPGKPLLPLKGVGFSRLSIKDGVDACLVPIPLPYFSRLSRVQHILRISSGEKKNEEVGLLIDSAENIAAAIELLASQGAVYDNTLARSWPFEAAGSKLKVVVNGWAVQVKCDLSNPLHYLVSPEQKYVWDAPYPYGKRVAVPWGGMINTTRKGWLALKSKILDAGLEWEGDDPEEELGIPLAFNANRVAGWDKPAPNGHLLHAYQKEGAAFCARRGMRALIGDEMGVGKTVQAIAAAEACGSPRILVVCPANARYVWDSEIRAWGGKGLIQHLTSQLDKLDLSARWHIVTYDLIAARAQTWRFNDEQEVHSFVKTFPELANDIEENANGPDKITLSSPLDKVPLFECKRVTSWEKMMQRLRGELLEQILAASPLLTILDEAHRAKNRDSKRTKAIKRIAAGGKQMLMLTGTPLRNNEHEAAVLLSLLDDQAETALSKQNGYTIQDVKDYLAYFMIRRTKADVLPELPDKTRQRIDICDLDDEQMFAYEEALNWAMECYSKARLNGCSEAEARQSMRGGIERARTALGSAKVLGGAVSDLVNDVVENKGCCVVFCTHHEVSDCLKGQLERGKLRVAVVDGRTPQKQRAAFVKEFQEGRLDVFIGGINAAGEAITLTRADTVIFVELDWVPGALQQAEDRIHRVGQKSNCQVIQLIARIPDGYNLDEMMVDLIGSKVARIGTVLDESTANIISDSIQSELQKRMLEGAKRRTALRSRRAPKQQSGPQPDCPRT